MAAEAAPKRPRRRPAGGGRPGDASGDGTADSNSFPALPPIDVLHGAHAVLAQASVGAQALLPRFMRKPEPTRHMSLQPSKTASAATIALFHAYHSVHAVIIADTANDVLGLVEAEESELRDAALHVLGEDSSLPPRPVGLTMLARGAAPNSSDSVTALNALAHLRASVPTCEMRISAFAGPDADAFVGRACPAYKDDTASVLFVVRWASGGNDKMETRVHRLSHAGLSAELIVQEVQAMLFALRSEAPIAGHIVRDLGGVPRDAFIQLHKGVTASFFSLTKSEPCFEVQQPAQSTLADTGVLLRLVERRGDASKDSASLAPLNHPSCFYGCLLADARHVADVRALCFSISKTDQGRARGLCTRSSEELAARAKEWSMHTCAVQAAGFSLGHRVTLYGTHGKLREPIQPPNSWIWRLSGAIVPLATASNNFAVFPCNGDAWMTNNRAYLMATRIFVNEMSKLYMEYVRSCGRAEAVDRKRRRAEEREAEREAEKAAHAAQAEQGEQEEHEPREQEEQDARESRPGKTLDTDMCSNADNFGTPDGDADSPEDAAADAHIAIEDNAADGFDDKNCSGAVAAAAFGLTLSSRRFTAGDAASRLPACDSTSALHDFLAASIRQFGVNTSLNDCIARAAVAVCNHATPVAEAAREREMARLRRISDAALLLGAHSGARPSAPSPAPGPTIDALVSFCGLRRGSSFYSPLPRVAKCVKKPIEDLAHTFCSQLRRALGVPKCANALRHACDGVLASYGRSVKKKMAHDDAALDAVRATAHILQNSAPEATCAEILCILVDASKRVVKIARATGGSRSAATVGECVDAVARGASCVLIGERQGVLTMLGATTSDPRV